MHELPEIVLFDIDGTLIDTGGAGGRAWNLAFKRLYGESVDIGEFTEAGMTDPVVASTTFKAVLGRDPSSRELSKLLHAYLFVIADTVAESPGYRVLEGVEPLLKELTEEGVLLAIVSGALEAAAHAKLGRGGLNQYFATGGYGSDSADRTEVTLRSLHRAERVRGKEADPTRVLVVGDTPRDIAAAHGAELVGVGVATGAFTVEQLTDSGADVALETLASGFPGVNMASRT